MRKKAAVSLLLAASFVLSLSSASDRQVDPTGAAARNPNETAIQPGAIKIPLPSMAQPDDYSCGAAALMSICSFYGVGEEQITDFKQKVHSNPTNGTNFENMIHYAHELGLAADAHRNMTIDELQGYIKECKPVICSIQAYGKPSDYDRNDNGHYVVAIGFDETNIYFMDPSVPAENRRRGFIPKADLPARWHDDEADKGQPQNIINHLGIVFYPKPGHTALLTTAMKVP